MPGSPAATVMALRQTMWANRYRPVPVYSFDANVASAGKRPFGKDWQNRARVDPPEGARTVPRLDVLNTGILCDGLRAIDIDIDDLSCADQVEKLAMEMLGRGPVRWRADSARRLILYRAAQGEPGKRVLLGSYGNIEVHGHGQQVVGYGRHPDGEEYVWRPADPALYHRDTLPAVTEAQIDAFFVAAAPLVGADALKIPKADRPPISLAYGLEPYSQTRPTERERAYTSKTLVNAVAKLAAMQPGGGRNQGLNNAALSLGEMVSAGWIDRKIVEAALFEASRLNGYRSKAGDEATWATLQSGLTAGMKNPRSPLPIAEILDGVRDFVAQGQAHFNKLSPPNSVATSPKSARSFQTEDGLIIHRVADVEAQPVRWLWCPRIALGKVTLISGDPGLGKSQLTAFLAARVSTGGLWPNDDGQSPSGSVLMLSCEDDVADTIRPRLEAVGADLLRVHVIEAVRTGEGQSRGFSLTADLAKLEAALERIPDVRLVSVDPITAYLGGTDTHRTSDVRAALGPLQTLAARYGVAVVAVSHLNKAGGSGKSVNAVTGSGAFVAAARASFLVIKDEDDEDRRLLIESKNNLGRAPGLSYRINQRKLAGNIVAPFVEFEPGTVNTTADEALGASILSGEGGAIREAEEFLRTELALGDVPTETLRRLASEADISWRTLRRAGDKIGAQRVKAGFQGGWVWRLPDPSKVAKKSEDGHAENLNTFGSLWPSSTRKDDGS